MTRKIDYLFLREGSRNWQLKLQYPGGERVEKSLGTPDRAQAEILALPYIQDHKIRLLEARPVFRSLGCIGLHRGRNTSHQTASGLLRMTAN
jgi:hypothetical protein